MKAAGVFPLQNVEDERLTLFSSGGQAPIFPHHLRHQERAEGKDVYILCPFL